MEQLDILVFLGRSSDLQMQQQQQMQQQMQMRFNSNSNSGDVHFRLYNLQ